MQPFEADTVSKMGIYQSTSIVTNGLTQYIDPVNPKASGDVGDFFGGNDATKTFPLELTVNTSQGYAEFNANSFFTVSSAGYPSDWKNQLTIDTWIYVPTSSTWSNGTTFGPIILKGAYTGHIGIGRSTNNNQICFSLRGDAATSIAYASITRDVWNHVSGVWNGTVASIALNGSIVQSSSPITHTGVPTSGASPNPNFWNFGRVGAFSGADGNKYVGRIGATKIYNRSLSAEEVRQNFTALRSRYGL